MSGKAKHVLVTGGAGYIGSHTSKALARRGFVPVTYDNLVYGHPWAVRWGPFVQGDIGDKAKLLETIHRYEIGAVIHFAAFAYVGESVKRPEIYFDNNVTKSLVLLDALVESKIRHIVFSSSCATYGSPEDFPIREETIQQPINPYGETKLIIERALRWYGVAHDLAWVALRYFNAAGADPDGDLGEVHSPETHLIPLVLDAALGRRTVEIYGDDYPTPDGTCVRDYIHVADLAEAHTNAIEYLFQGSKSVALNLGTGHGYSVRNVVSTAAEITGHEIPHRIAPRREGDPAVLVADPTRAGATLGWYPKCSQLDEIVRTAWEWHRKYAVS